MPWLGVAEGVAEPLSELEASVVVAASVEPGDSEDPDEDDSSGPKGVMETPRQDPKASAS